MKNVSIGSVIYIIIGVVIAINQGYLLDVGSLSQLVSALLAIVFWPLLLLGVNLQITF